jgi:hypothetical protein
MKSFAAPMAGENGIPAKSIDRLSTLIAQTRYE